MGSVGGDSDASTEMGSTYVEIEVGARLAGDIGVDSVAMLSESALRPFPRVLRPRPWDRLVDELATDPSRDMLTDADLELLAVDLRWSLEAPRPLSVAAPHPLSATAGAPQVLSTGVPQSLVVAPQLLKSGLAPQVSTSAAGASVTSVPNSCGGCGSSTTLLGDTQLGGCSNRQSTL